MSKKLRSCAANLGLVFPPFLSSQDKTKGKMRKGKGNRKRRDDIIDMIRYLCPQNRIGCDKVNNVNRKNWSRITYTLHMIQGMGGVLSKKGKRKMKGMAYG